MKYILAIPVLLLVLWAGATLIGGAAAAIFFLLPVFGFVRLLSPKDSAKK